MPDNDRKTEDQELDGYAGPSTAHAVKPGAQTRGKKRSQAEASRAVNREGPEGRLDENLTGDTLKID
jgi:hypothetical protein